MWERYVSLPYVLDMLETANAQAQAGDKKRTESDQAKGEPCASLLHSTTSQSATRKRKQMAKSELTLYVKAKNMLAVGLATASKALKSFGSGVLKVGKWVATGFIAASTAIVAAAYQAQEFNKKISQISTLSNLPIRTLKKEVISLSAEFGLAKDEAYKRSL